LGVKELLPNCEIYCKNSSIVKLMLKYKKSYFRIIIKQSKLFCHKILQIGKSTFRIGVEVRLGNQLN